MVRTREYDCEEMNEETGEPCAGTVTATGTRQGGEAECDTCDWSIDTY